MKPLKLIIVGGVAGGASAAARARRLSESAEIVMLERGPYISFANCGLPYHIGGDIPDRDRLLVQTPQAMRARFRVDVRVGSEVRKIDRKHREVVILERSTGREYRERYDKLILSPGAEPVHPPLPGFDLPGVMSLRNMEDMDRILTHIHDRDARRAAIVGGGFIGLEMAEALRNRGMDVDLVELSPQVLAPLDPEMAALVHAELQRNGVSLHLQTSVTELRARGQQIEVLLDHGDPLLVDMVIPAIGVRPETRLAREADLRLGDLGGIAVNAHMQTSDPDIYAVGDAVEIIDLVTKKPGLIPLAGPANRQGRIAADHLFGRQSSYGKTQGTSICKVFHLAAGTTGANEKILKRRGIAYEKIYLHAASHAGYYPGAVPISLKLLFCPDSGRILGAQAVGADGVDKRIDVIATALRFQGTVEDLEQAELSYAPPYGSAKDVVNYAGFVASNVRNGDMAICHVPDILAPRDGQLLLDVRTSEEVAAGTLPGAVNIPLDQLRDRIAEVAGNREILVFCQVGLRGYLACRILTQNGFSCRNLTGGYRLVQMFTGLENDLMKPVGTSGAAELRSDAGDTTPTTAGNGEVRLIRTVDACGLQCPGPILQLKQALDEVQNGESIQILSTDPGFAADVPAWCHSTGHDLLELDADNGVHRAIVRKHGRTAGPASALNSTGRRMTIVVFSGDFDKAVAAFIIANGAASMGYEPTLFFTFWGLNILRRDHQVKVRKTFIERMFGSMMPRGPKKLALSKMHMAGMGTAMIQGIMKRKGVPSLPEMIGMAKASGVRLVACNMTMELMGFRREELVDGVHEGGVASYLDAAGQGNVNLFI